jgi:hypothetical protein
MTVCMLPTKVGSPCETKSHRIKHHALRRHMVLAYAVGLELERRFHIR